MYFWSGFPGHRSRELRKMGYTPKAVDIEMVCDQSVDRDKGLQWLIDELAASVVV